MNKVELAIHFAVAQHHGQVDKLGDPYILHVLRVASGVNPADQDSLIAAVLHDVVEDTSMQLITIKAHFGDAVAEIVDHLTRRHNENYADFIERCGQHTKARAIKILDLNDNLRHDRISRLPEEERKRLRGKYFPALTRLMAP